MSDDDIKRIAREYVLKMHSHVPQDRISVLETHAKPDGMRFGVRGVLGGCHFFVTRESGEIWPFSEPMGQAEPRGVEYWLNWYAQGWRLGLYRLTVRKVRKPWRFAWLIVGHGVEYPLRELATGVVWSRMVRYTMPRVLMRIRNLPCVFTVDALAMSEIAPKLRAAGIADFECVFAGEGRKHDWRAENVGPDELGPQYDYA